MKMMAPIRVRPTRADVSIANAISDHTGRSTERAAELVPWGADERIICALVGAGPVLTRVVLLAHWAGDVAAGLAGGACLERMLRLVTGYGRRRQALRARLVD
jgi:hypothetical protein